MGHYINRFRDGVPLENIEKDVVGRLYRTHREDGVGTLIVGLLPCGGVLLYQQAFFDEDSCLEIKRAHRRVPMAKAETAEVISALALLDHKITRRQLA